MNEKAKERIARRLRVDRGQTPSAQEYRRMTDEEREALRQVLQERGQDPDEYESRMKSLFPPEVGPRAVEWRDAYGRRL